MIRRVFNWLTKKLSQSDTKEIAKKRLEFIIIRDRNSEDEKKIKFLKKRLDPTLSSILEEGTYELELLNNEQSELLIHIPIRYVKLSKEEEHEYCVNCE